MLTYDMERRGRLPLYDYLCRCIKEDIWNGALGPGEKLPSKRALARHLEVAVATVENAYSQLVAEGYLYAEEKRGYFVSPLETGDRPRPAEAVHASGPACALPMPQRDWLLDLTSGGAGTEGFPFTVWARLMRRVLTDRGEQLLLAQVRSGQYKGETMQVYNYVGPLYGQPLKVGQRAVLLISTYEDGSHTATVYEYDRAVGLAVIVGLFLLATVLVGGKVGAKSLVALAVTLVCLFWILIPLLMQGASTLLTVFLVCAYITVVTMVILGGVCRKTVCAALGTVAGTALALLFGLRIDGLRLTDVEPLLQLRQTGTPLGLRGLLVAGVVISALGAVMDVAMSISSALTEVHTVAPDRDGRALFRSGMNIGRDMVGTMTNTLILAFLGSGLSFIIYLYSLGLDPRQLISSPYMATEVISGIASSIGVILAVPLTALITSFILVKDKKPKAPCGSKPEDKKLPKEVQ